MLCGVASVDPAAMVALAEALRRCGVASAEWHADGTIARMVLGPAVDVDEDTGEVRTRVPAIAPARDVRFLHTRGNPFPRAGGA